MFHRIGSRLSLLRPFVLGGAWLFIVVSLAHLLWVVGGKWSDAGGTYKLYHTVVGGLSYDAWGLTYTGTAGLVQAMAQLALVAAAAVVTVAPLNRRTKWRRLGHGVLTGWSALWAVNLIWLASVDGQLDSIAQAMLLCLLLGCTGYRAINGWAPPRSQGGSDVGPDRSRSRHVRFAPRWLPEPFAPPPPPPPPESAKRPAPPQPPDSPDLPETPDVGERSGASGSRREAVRSKLRAVFGRIKTFNPAESERLKRAIAFVCCKIAVVLSAIACFVRRQAARLAPGRESSEGSTSAGVTGGIHGEG